MKRYYIFYLSALLCNLLLVVFLLLFVTQAIAQGSNDQMQRKVFNFSTFTEKTRSNNLNNWEKFNDPADFDHPEFGYLPDGAPCENCVEVYSKRTIDERYFVDGIDPSKYYQQKALGELHAKDANGDWVTIDHRINPIENNRYESKFIGEKAGFDLEQRRTYIETSLGKIFFNDWTLYTKTANELVLQHHADWSDFTAGDDGIYVKNIFPGIDAELIVYRGAIKTNFILKENVFGTFDALIFRDQFAAPSLPSLAFLNGEMSQGSGDLVVYSGNSDVLHVSEGILYARGGPKELAQVSEYLLTGNKLDVIVPFDWINDNIGQYNLVVDPLVTGTNTLAQAAITGSMYNASCNFTNSCNYTLAVPRPANATITNVQWSFNYTANGSCWLQDGATRFAVGGCVSPATAGFYWFCNLTGNGTCTGTNISIFNDVAACIPAPGCTAQNVTFTLQFFRSCWGTTGCNNACIGAGSPWTMTISGQTIAFTNSVNPVTVSATTVCQGGSVTASTAGTWGVPGYTYNWSFSPTGIPSIGSGATATITFPTSGSITLYSIVTDACGNQVTSTRVITVTPGPTISVNSPTICAGASATLTASGATTYTWSPAGGLSTTTGANVTATPSLTTTYTVTGTTSGCSGTATATVTVNPNPTVSVNSPTICAGGNATLTASGATSYTWSPSGGLSATTGTTVTATPPATTTYTVTGTTAGCSGTATATVTVTPNPLISVNSPTICAGGSATLTASGATSYIWSPAGGLSSTTGSSVTATPAATTTYSVTGTTAGCSGTATATVSVNPNPVVSVNSPTICNGDNVILTASGATTYTWSPSGGLSSTTGSSVTANPSTTTSYTVTGTENGCSGTATATVTVNPIPVVSGNDETICAGGSVTLTASGATTYTWSPASGLSATTGTSVTANPSTTTVYTISGTTNGCTGTGTVTVTVNLNPIVTVNSPTICAGASATLTASGATSYNWSPAGGLSSTSGASVTATPASTTTYTVTGTTSGCNGTAMATVTVSPNPVVTVNNPTICAGSNATLTASGATSYTWSPAGGLSSTTGASVTASPATTTTYTVTGTENGCIGTATSTVTVNALPIAAASNNGPLCPGDVLNLSATNVPGATYSWSGPGAFNSVLQNPTFSPMDQANAGVYTLVVTLNGCSSTTTTDVAMNPGVSTAINPAGPYCANGSPVLLSGASPGGTWSGNGIVNPATGLFDPSAAVVGNNTVTYDVPGGCGGASTATIIVLPIPSVSFASDVSSGCAPLPVTFTNLSSPLGTSVMWNFGNGGTSTNIASASTQYTNDGCFDVTLTVTDNLGCSNTQTINDLVCVLPDPVAAFSVDDPTATLTDPGFQFINNSVNAVSYEWFFDDGTTSSAFSPSHDYSTGAGGYTVELVALNAAGCTDTARLNISIVEELLFYIPNAFTPDGDEYNNAFEPVFTSGFDPYSFSMVIYNRWGETLFETQNHEIGWDGTYAGKMVPEGVYTWTVYFKDKENDDKHEYTGHVLLIR